MKIELKDVIRSNHVVDYNFDENTTLKDLLTYTRWGGPCRILKVPKTDKDRLQTININPGNINSTLVDLGFQDNATYTFIQLIINLNSIEKSRVLSALFLIKNSFNTLNRSFCCKNIFNNSNH